MGVSTGEPPAQVGSWGEWEHSQSSMGAGGGGGRGLWVVMLASPPWSSQH